jgi:malonyl-CoA O-methyltransferase
MPFQSEIFDHVWSTSALHWAQDLHQVFAECARLLKPQGYMYLSTFIEGTLREIQDTWIKVDGSPHTLTFRSAQDYIHALKEKGFQLIHQETQSFSIDFNSPREVLHSLKRIGSSVAPATSHLISPLRLKQFEAEYWSQYGSPSHTVPVSYETVFFILKKDGPS